MRIITFHGIGGPGAGGIHYPAQEFEAHLRYLAEHFSIVSLASLLSRVLGEEPSNGREVALTFDDGLRNHYTVVLPILRRLQLPATYFVCSGLIESGRWAWPYEALARLRFLPLARRATLSTELGAPTNNAEKIFEWMTTLPSKSRASAEEAIRDATPRFQATQQQHDDFDVMTWDELSAIPPDLVTIGSHTISHPILNELDAGEILHEICESQRQLADRLHRPIEHFCYPNGSHNATVVECVRNFYRSAVTTADGTVSVGDDPHRLKRITAAERLPTLAWRMYRPSS